MTDLMPMMDAYKVLMSNIAKFAEANGAELDYTHGEQEYWDSVHQWYIKYVAEKHISNKEYDEYIEVINDIMFEIMSRLTWEGNNIYIPDKWQECEIDNVGKFITDGPQDQLAPIVIFITEKVLTTNGNPFFAYEKDSKTGDLEPKLKCPQEVVELIQAAGYLFDTAEVDSQRVFKLETPCKAITKSVE